MDAHAEKSDPCVLGHDVMGVTAAGGNAAASLARLWRDRDPTEKGHKLLSRIHDRFTEGFETADLKAAKSLVTNLRARRPPMRL
jgi:hypothetical protein